MKTTKCLATALLALTWSLALVGQEAATDSVSADSARFASQKGSYLQVGGGIGVSELHYGLTGGTIAPKFPSFTANVGYAYYFLPYMGIGIGVGVSNYGTTATFTEPQVWTNLTDEFGDEYEHRTEIVAWQEKQLAYLLEVPVALRFKENFGRRVGLFAHVGAKFAMPVYATRQLTDATVAHTGYYPFWNLTLHDLPNRFETETFDGKKHEIKQFAKYYAIVFAEIGANISLSQRVDLLLGVYANCGTFNLDATKEADKKGLGFANEQNGYGSFMPTYEGLLATKNAGSVLPWSVGVKAEFNFFVGKTEAQKAAAKKRKEAKAAAKIQHDTIYICDTIYRDLPPTEMAVVPDIPQPEATATVSGQQRLDDLLKRAVIWFRFDSYEPIVEPSYLLDSVRAMLHAHRDVAIQINGHACKIGHDEYNQRLAMRRAEAVQALLQKMGVDARQMRVASFGANYPFHYSGEHLLRYDRRVEIVPITMREMDDYWGRMPQPAAGRAPIYDKYDSFQSEEELKPGMSLAQLARKHYGITEFWVYIYEANADRIKNPNRLPDGLTIMIPRLDVNDDSLRRHAKELEQKYKNAK